MDDLRGETDACDRASPRGRRVLVVEDEPLIALQVADDLSTLGCVVVGPAFELPEARYLAVNSPVDAAFVDLNLHGSSSNEVADILTRRQIPFAVITGYPQPLEDAHGAQVVLAGC